MHCRQIDSLKERYEACRIWLCQQAYHSTCPSLKLYLCLSCFSQFLAVGVSSVCQSDVGPPPPQEADRGRQVIDSGEGGREKATNGEQWTVTLCSSLWVSVYVGVLDCDPVTNREANRSNRGALSTCQAVPSQHTAAFSLYSFTGVSISVCGNCAALHVCLCMHRYRWQIIILLAFSRTYTKEICSDFWFSAHFLFY